MKANIMSIFKKNLETHEAEKALLTTEVAELTQELADALGSVEELATLKNANTVLETKLEDSAKEVVTLTASQADFDTKVSSAVAKQVADSGLKQDKIDGNNDKPELNLLEKMNLMEEDEAQDFYKANKASILALHALKN